MTGEGSMASSKGNGQNSTVFLSSLCSSVTYFNNLSTNSTGGGSSREKTKVDTTSKKKLVTARLQAPYSAVFSLKTILGKSMNAMAWLEINGIESLTPVHDWLKCENL